MAAKSKMKAMRGFTLIELIIAIVVMLVGVVAVAKLVPASIQNNMNSRQDITAIVVAQRELDQMMNQPLDSATFVDSDGRIINLGTAGGPGTSAVSGGPFPPAGVAQINFNAGAVPGYTFNYTDPNNANGATYEVRWGVVVTTNAGGRIASKRFIIGCWRRDPRQLTQPVNIDTTVNRF